MVREYVDFHIEKLDEGIATRLSMFGFTRACVVNPRVRPGIFSGIRVYPKVVVEAQSRGNVLEAARDCVGKAILCIKPLSREALMTACKDERVATVMVHGEIAEFDRHVHAVFSNAVEVSVAELAACFEDEKRWRTLIDFVGKAASAGRRIVMSSGASDVEEIIPPQQLALVAAALTSRKNSCQESVSSTPLSILRDRLFE